MNGKKRFIRRARQQSPKAPAKQMHGGHVHDVGERMLTEAEWQKICGDAANPGTAESESAYLPGENQNYFGDR